MAKIQPLNS